MRLRSLQGAKSKPPSGRMGRGPPSAETSIQVSAATVSLTSTVRRPKLGDVRLSSRQLDARQRSWQAEVTARLPALLAELLAADDCASSPPRTHGIYLFRERGSPMYVGRTGKTERSIAKEPVRDSLSRCLSGIPSSR